VDWIASYLKKYRLGGILKKENAAAGIVSRPSFCLPAKRGVFFASAKKHEAGNKLLPDNDV